MNVEFHQTSRQYPRVIVGLFFVVAMVVFGVWLVPKGLALYYQIRGGSILEQVITVGAVEREVGFSVAAGSLWDPTLDLATDADVLSLANEAISRLNKAITFNPDLSHAYLLLGRTFLLLGDYETAVQKYRTYTNLRPNNPLGYWELAQALEAYCRLESAKKIGQNPVETDLLTARCSNQTMKENIRAAINESGITSADFLKVSREAIKVNNYQDMQKWYEWALLVAGDKLDTIPESLINHIQMLEWFDTAEAWKPCPWCGNVEGRFAVENGVLVMCYRNTPDKRDGFAFLLNPNISVDHFQELLLRIRGEPGTLLTMEIVVDRERSRPYNYRLVPEEWSVWTTPINGHTLGEILIGIGEPETIPLPEEYCLFIDWIALR